MEEQANYSVKWGSHELLRSKSEQRPEEDEGLKEMNNSKRDPGKEYSRQKKTVNSKKGPKTMIRVEDASKKEKR